MGRSVILAGAPRCPGCCLPPRWCTCGLLPPVVTRLPVQVLIHRQEHQKPTSSGRLVVRAVANAAGFVYQRQNHFFPATGYPTVDSGSSRRLWVLHPSGDPMPLTDITDDDASTWPTILLLDGTWRQAREMLPEMRSRGRCVRLPEGSSGEPSRYWLREQPGPSQLSTAESLVHLLHAFGEFDAERQLRNHFELFVYATLLARGRREMSERYLGHSPLPTEAHEAIDRLHARPSAYRMCAATDCRLERPQRSAIARGMSSESETKPSPS
ncbi:MAG: tRNA-uridine aminocarboxypropyltransferase [Planctomycetaceae bacterium]